MLKFRDKAKSLNRRPDNISDAEAYKRYINQMRQIVEREEGRVMFACQVAGLLIGKVENMWDAIGMAEYPSREKFMRIVSLPEVREIGLNREAGLAGQRLMQTKHAF